MNKYLYENLVKFFGSQKKTADVLGVAQPSVNAWVSGKSRMNAVNAIRAEKLTNGKFKATELCPRLAEIEAMEVPSSPNPQTQNKNPKR